MMWRDRRIYDDACQGTIFDGADLMRSTIAHRNVFGRHWSARVRSADESKKNGRDQDDRTHEP